MFLIILINICLLTNKASLAIFLILLDLDGYKNKHRLNYYLTQVYKFTEILFVIRNTDLF